MYKQWFKHDLLQKKKKLPLLYEQCIIDNKIVVFQTFTYRKMTFILTDFVHKYKFFSQILRSL